MSSLPYSVALTGGIASGKSTVAKRLAELGAWFADADTVARELVKPGTPALAEIIRVFGADALHPDGTLDRRALRAAIFADDAARQRLNAILHPRIRAALHEHVVATPQGRYALLAIPLLVENRSQYAWVNRVLVVDAPRDLQLARLVARDGVTPALAQAMLDAQASREQRLAIADDVIRNSGSLDLLDGMVGALHERYSRLAGQRPP